VVYCEKVWENQKIEETICETRFRVR